MASPWTHASIIILAFYFPELSLIGLLVGSLIPDIESFYFYIKKLIVKRNAINAYLNTPQGILHTLIGIPINLILSMITIYIISNALHLDLNLSSIAVSALIGIISHLILDIPGHKDLLIFYPHKIKNPFMFRLRLRFLEIFYPWKGKEERPMQVIREYNWWLFSHVFLFIAIALYLLQ